MFALLATVWACGRSDPGSGISAAGSSSAVAPSEPTDPPPSPATAPAPEPDASSAPAPPDFPADHRKIDVNTINDCMVYDIWSSKDRAQIEERIHYCVGGRSIEGKIVVAVEITGNGAAKKVDIRTEGRVPDEVLGCVRRLVEATPFGSEGHQPRRITATVSLPEPSPSAATSGNPRARSPSPRH